MSTFSTPDVSSFPRAGTKVLHIIRELLSIAPGSLVDVPLQVDVSHYSAYHVHYKIDASVAVNIYWSVSVRSDFGHEKTILLPATVGDVGGILTGSTKSKFLSITFTNTDIVPLTSIYVSIYAVA